jgi:hypothetical protein
MAKLKWQKMKRFTETFYWSGIYKITSYTYHRGHDVKPYYQVYVLCSTNWGNYVDGSKQRDKMLTLKECRELAQAHHDENGEPHHSRLKAAQNAMDRWMECDTKRKTA